MSDEMETYADVHVNAFLTGAAGGGMAVVRGSVKHKASGLMFEVVGMDRSKAQDGSQVVPLFLVPIGGSKTLTQEYEVIAPDDVNPNTVVFDKSQGGVH